MIQKPFEKKKIFVYITCNFIEMLLKKIVARYFDRNLLPSAEANHSHLRIYKDQI